MTLTRQEIFDTAYRGLKSQGFKRSVARDGSCLYQGNKGRKCAVGHIIPNDRYRSDMEGRPADAVADDYLTGIISIGEYDFIWELQKCHDDARLPKDMQERLRKFAEKYGLKIADEAVPS